MPIWLRKFHIQEINKFLKKQKEESDKVQKGQQSTLSKINVPNIQPSSTYNFKK